MTASWVLGEQKGVEGLTGKSSLGQRRATNFWCGGPWACVRSAGTSGRGQSETPLGGGEELLMTGEVQRKHHMKVEEHMLRGLIRRGLSVVQEKSASSAPRPTGDPLR